MTDTITTETDEWQLPFEAILESHRERIPGNEDMVPSVVEAWRIGELSPCWSTFIGPGKDIESKEAMLYAASVMAMSSNADYIVCVMDTHMSKSQTNPKTGEPWKAGEMQGLCDDEGFCETGQIRDNLLVCAIRRDGKLRMAMIPYHFHNGEVMYFDPEPPMDEWETTQDAPQIGGYIPNRLREAMAKPTMNQILEDAANGGDVGDVYAAFGMEKGAPDTAMHQVMAGIRIMAKAAENAESPYLFAHALFTTSDTENMIIAESVLRSKIEAEISLLTTAPPQDSDL